MHPLRQHARGTRAFPVPGADRRARAAGDLRRVLGGVAEAADDADQPLRARPDGQAGARVPDAQHGSLPLQEGERRGSGHQQTGQHHLVNARAGAAALAFVAALGACNTAPPPAAAPAPVAHGSTWEHCRGATDSAWVDCVVGALTVREKAAQMVWPRAFGDYTARDDRTWRATLRLVTHERVGGVIMSIGSPLEITSKLNELQRASDLPLLVGADLETGAGFRARGGWFLPNAIDLGGAVNFPPSMALGATRDTALAYQEGRVTAREGRALGIQIDFAPVLDVNNNAANPVISTRSYGEDPQAVRSEERRVGK